jgi:propionyl-CoA synthetase
MGRTDDVLNVAGHRLSAGAIEAALGQHPSVAECAVIGVADELRGQVPCGFVVLRSGEHDPRDVLAAALIALVRAQVGAIAMPKDVSVVYALAKTRFGKIPRKSIREIADLGETTLPSTIEDPSVLDRLRPVLRQDA